MIPSSRLCSNISWLCEVVERPRLVLILTLEQRLEVHLVMRGECRGVAA